MLFPYGKNPYDQLVSDEGDENIRCRLLWAMESPYGYVLAVGSSTVSSCKNKYDHGISLYDGDIGQSELLWNIPSMWATPKNGHTMFRNSSSSLNLFQHRILVLYL